MDRTAGARAVKWIVIGSSKGILLPEVLLWQYRWSDLTIPEAAEAEVFLRGKERSKLAWTDAYRAMAASEEDWSELNAAAAGGLD